MSLQAKDKEDGASQCVAIAVQQICEAIKLCVYEDSDTLIAAILHPQGSQYREGSSVPSVVLAHDHQFAPSRTVPVFTEPSHSVVACPCLICHKNCRTLSLRLLAITAQPDHGQGPM